MLKKGPF
jgi:ATP adenylyltransferase/5',5'''-P-1,P-4-tetraphosphate phosphorylase II